MLKSLPYRYVYAIATEDSVFFYHTQSLTPFSYICGIHYSNLSDLSWSPDGKYLIITSIDGFCTFVFFKQNELGKVYQEPVSESSSSTTTTTSTTTPDESKATGDTESTKTITNNQNMEIVLT